MVKRVSLIILAVLVAGGSSALAQTAATAPDPQAEPERAVRVIGADRGAFLGAQLGEVDQQAAQRLGLREERGVLLLEVEPEGPAGKAGLQKDDVIIKWNGNSVESRAQFMRHMRETPGGRTVRIGVLRGGRELELDVKLGERSQYRARTVTRPVRVLGPNRGVRVITPRVSMGGRMGVAIHSLTPQLAEYFGLKNEEGALIVSVRENSPAAKAGLRAGDVILSVDGESVGAGRGVARVLRKKDEGAVEVKVMREKKERTFKVELEKGDKTSWLVTPDDMDDLTVEPLTITLPDIHINELVTVPMPKIVLPGLTLPTVKLPSLSIPPIDIRLNVPFRIVI